MPTSLLAAAPVVDIDGTLWVQGGLFLGMVLLLRPLLFRPWLEAQARRARAIDGAFAEAARLRQEADRIEGTYTAKYAEARERATSLRSKVRREEEGTQAVGLHVVREEASAQLAREQARIAQEAAAARRVLSSRVDELAHQIAAKVLGRSP